MSFMPDTLLFVVNDPAFFVSQHQHLAEAAEAAGYTVAVAAPEGPGADVIRQRFPLFTFRLSRGAIRPHLELQTVRDLTALYRRVQPDLVYHITLKIILYGTYAARRARVPAVVNANTGLGYTFIDDSPRTALLRGIMERMYRRWVRHENRTDLFLNPDDRDEFIRRGLAQEATSKVITGPGVDVDAFRPSPEPEGEPVVMLAARMLWHKGVAEFVEAARFLRRCGAPARFVLVGDVDPGNLASVDRASLEAWQEEGVIEWWGFRTDMAEVFSQAHVVVLPSYREGLGKVLIEGAACGRALVATNVAGCREIARHGENALLVPPRNPLALTVALNRLIRDAGLRQRFGRAGRRIVEDEFANETIAEQTLAVFRERLPMPCPIFPLIPREPVAHSVEETAIVPN